MASQPAIIWPPHFLPGTTDNFVSNETIASGLSASQIWANLADISKWELYYSNVSDITPPSSGPLLKKGDRFHFSTFGFPAMPAEVVEAVAPGSGSGSGEDGKGRGKEGRIAWRAWQDGGEEERLEVYHAWIVEDLEGGRVRILTQESQIGGPARELSQTKPNRMLNGHQEWLDGLVGFTRTGKGGEGEGGK